MTITTAPKPRDVSARLNYYTPMGTEAPYQHVRMEPPESTPAHNLGKDWREVVVNDARGREEEFSLDKQGFQFVCWPIAEEKFDDEARIQKEYYAEVEQLLKTVTGAKRVFIFNHLIRRSSGKGDPLFTRPAERVHVDQTFERGVQFVKLLFPDEADHLLKSRVRIINVWRPINHPVAHHPLGLSDWRYVDERDLVPVRSINPDHEARDYSVRYNPEHRWYYLSDQSPDEVTLFKCYDSAVDRAKCSPHTAFVDTSSPKEAPGRESIEVRALVFDAE